MTFSTGSFATYTLAHRCAFYLFYVLLYFLTMGIVREQYSKCHSRHFFIYACADSSEWGLFGRCARSAFRRTPSGRVAQRKLSAQSSALYSASKNFFQKIHSRGKSSKYYTSRVLYIPFYSQKSQIFSTKPPKRWVFSTTIIIEAQIFDTLKPQKAHRYPTDLLSWSRNLQRT